MSEAAVATPAAPAAAPAAPTPAAPVQQPAATPPAQGGGYLGGDTPPASGESSNTPTYLFRENFAKDGNFVEGWSEVLAKDFPRLAAKGATAKSEAGFLKMMEDTIGFASGKRITRPDAAASEQAVAEYRALTGAPVTASEYAFKPSKIPEGMQWDDATTTTVNALLHKHHVPKEFAAELAEFYTGEIEKQAAKGKEAWSARTDELAAQTEAMFRKEWGADHDTRRDALRDFISARELDMNDPVVKLAVHHPQIARMIDEARRASREAPIPGVDKEVFNGSASPGQQAKAIMTQDRSWRSKPEVFKRVMDLYRQQAVIDRRKAK